MTRYWIIFYISFIGVFPAYSQNTEELSPSLQDKIAALEKELEALKIQIPHPGSKTSSDPHSQDEKKHTSAYQKNKPSSDTSSPQHNSMGETPAQGRAHLSIKETKTDAESLYSRCQEYLSEGRIDLAEGQLKQLVEQHAQSPQAVLGYFWLGELYALKRNYAEASLSYGTAYGALKKLKLSTPQLQALFNAEYRRLPEILAKLAYSLKMLGKTKEACITIKQLHKEYKVLPENLAWFVHQQKRELKCS